MISRFRIPRKYKLRIGINKGLYDRLFVFIIVFPVVSYIAKYYALIYFEYPAILPSFNLSFKLICLLFFTYGFISLIVLSILKQTRFHKGINTNYRLGFYFFSLLTLAVALSGNPYLQRLFPIDFVVLLAIIFGHIPMLIVSVLLGTLLGSKGTLVWAIMFFYIAYGASLKRGVILALAFPLALFLYIAGRAARFSARKADGLDFSFFLSELIEDLTNKDTYQNLVLSMVGRLNQYDGVEFAMRAADRIQVSVLDIGFLFNRVVASFVPGVRGEQSFGAYIGRLMNPEKSFEYGFAGAMGILGQFVIIDPFEIFVFILYLVVTFGIGGFILSRYLGNQAILILLSLQLTQILMSGNLDSTLVNLLRLIFAVIFFTFLNKFLMSFGRKSAVHNTVMQNPNYRKPY